MTDAAAIAYGVVVSDVTINTAEADDIDLVRPPFAAMTGTGKTDPHQRIEHRCR